MSDLWIWGVTFGVGCVLGLLMPFVATTKDGKDIVIAWGVLCVFDKRIW